MSELCVTILSTISMPELSRSHWVIAAPICSRSRASVVEKIFTALKLFGSQVIFHSSYRRKNPSRHDYFGNMQYLYKMARCHLDAHQKAFCQILQHRRLRTCAFGFFVELGALLPIAWRVSTFALHLVRYSHVVRYSHGLLES